MILVMFLYDSGVFFMTSFGEATRIAMFLVLSLVSMFLYCKMCLDLLWFCV